MTVTVFSDTHGSIGGMMRVIREIKPDVIIHLGDCERDTEKIRAEFPTTPLYAVCGNCDYSPRQPLTDTVNLGSVRAFITHGHIYNVKWGDLSRLAYAALEAEAKIALFGHTHCADALEMGGVTLINPGTAGMGKNKTYAYIETMPNGAFMYEIRDIGEKV